MTPQLYKCIAITKRMGSYQPVDMDGEPTGEEIPSEIHTATLLPEPGTLDNGGLAFSFIPDIDGERFVLEVTYDLVFGVRSTPEPI